MDNFLNNVAGVDNSTSKKTSSQVFSCKFQENFLRSFLTEQLRATTSGGSFCE